MNAVVYSTQSCPYCTMAKNYLKEKNIRYTDIDVSRDPRKAQEMVKISGQQGVPVLRINGKVILGFNKREIDNALQRAN